MPCVRIATGTWALGSEIKLIEAVQSALVQAFKLPEADRDVVLDLYPEHRRIVPGGRSVRYTRVEIIGIAARQLMPSGSFSRHSPIIWRPWACRATRHALCLSSRQPRAGA